MAKVTGLGGIFFKSRDPATLAAWYAEHLGLKVDDGGGVRFDENEHRPGCMLWMPFAADTDDVGPGMQPWMINVRIDDLDALSAPLRSAGVDVDEPIKQSEFGRFGWISDPAGTRIEWWQPPA